MKQQYESEILFHLMERDGFNIPSSVPPYEAEIKAYLINQVKQAYPKLTDYEAEWLLYNYTKHLPADFPISSVTNVTKATFENVVPFAYKTAILSGQTLVNLGLNNIISFSFNGEFLKKELIKPNTEYTLIYEVAEVSENVTTTNVPMFTETVLPFGKGIHKIKRTTVSNISDTAFKIWGNDTNERTITIKNLIVIEGDYTNLDIPYFEGMQSVKMPVLTTTGKNLFDGINHGYFLNGTSTLAGLTSNDSGGVVDVSNMDEITISSTMVQSRFRFAFTNTLPLQGESPVGMFRGVNLDGNPSTKATIDCSGYKYLIINATDLNIIQVEDGTIATSYEPHKSNILTVDGEYGSVGNVCDTVDLLSGEVVENTKEIVINGGENILFGGEIDNTYRFAIIASTDHKIDSLVSCSHFKSIIGWNNDEEGIYASTSTNGLVLKLLKTRGISTVELLRTWLQSNNVVVRYQLATPTVKTVDLKTVNESGESIYFMPLEGTMHIHSDGTPLKPTITMEIPVEATTQNLASFIDLEAEE